MAVLVVAEHNNTDLKDATHKTVTAAAAMGGDVDVLVAGKGVKDVAAAAAKIAGVRKVISCDHVSLTRQLAESMEEVIVPLMGGYDAVLAPDTTTHKNYMPRIAAKLDVQQISSITGVESADTFVRPISTRGMRWRLCSPQMPRNALRFGRQRSRRPMKAALPLLKRLLTRLGRLNLNMLAKSCPNQIVLNSLPPKS